MSIMRTYTTRLAGNFVARCPDCGAVCAYWDDEDLDEDGNLICDACEEVDVPCAGCGGTDMPLHVDYRCPDCHALDEEVDAHGPDYR